VIGLPFFFLYRAIVSSIALVSLRSALIASALRFFSYAIRVFLLLPFPSRCRSKASIFGSCCM